MEPVDSAQTPISQGPLRRMAIRFNIAASLALAAVLVFLVNYLSFRHYRRADWSQARFYQLSEKTLRLLNSLTSTVVVIVFFQPDHELYEDVTLLLNEYRQASRRIHVEKVDPDRDLARTEELKQRYQVTEANVVVFDAGGRRKFVRANDLADYDYTPLQFGQMPARTTFKGEQVFSSALHSLTQTRPPKVYFLTGHGERDLTDRARGVGYSDVAELIQQDNIELNTLLLAETRQVPGDADALVVAGPRKRISDVERDLLHDYLDRNGRILFLLDALTPTGLEPLLAGWGVSLVEDVVVDATRTLTGRDLFLTEYGRHPITRGLGHLSAVLFWPRSVEPLEKEGEAGADDRPVVVSLAACSESGWAETDHDQNPMRYDPERDRPGPVSVAVAVEKGPPPSIDVQIRPTRLVIIGDSDFVANGMMTGANSDLFMGALNWLLEREDLLAIAAKPLEQARLIMTDDQLRGLFWLLVGALPGSLALLGALVWWRRRA